MTFVGVDLIILVSWDVRLIIAAVKNETVGPVLKFTVRVLLNDGVINFAPFLFNQTDQKCSAIVVRIARILLDFLDLHCPQRLHFSDFI